MRAKIPPPPGVFELGGGIDNISTPIDFLELFEFVKEKCF